MVIPKPTHTHTNTTLTTDIHHPNMISTTPFQIIISKKHMFTNQHIYLPKLLIKVNKMLHCHLKVQLINQSSQRLIIEMDNEDQK